MEKKDGGRLLALTSSPHIRGTDSTRRIMLDVCIAMVPAVIAGVIIFGSRALAQVLVAMVVAVAAEAATQRLMHKPVTVSDCSALVTGMLIALNVPVTAPFWLTAMGTIIAIVLVKQFFGGLGKNFLNPAMTARAIMLASWMPLMASSAFTAPLTMNVDAYTGATPLAVADTSLYSLGDLFLGNIPGAIGEVSKLALLIGAAYLFVRRVITWRIPVTILGTVFLLSWINSGAIYSDSTGCAMYQLLSGGLILAAFFMATDYSSSPMTPVGQLIYGVGCGLLIFVIRNFNPTYPEGCTYALLFMNLCVPLLDRYTAPKIYGRVKKNA